MKIHDHQLYLGKDEISIYLYNSDHEKVAQIDISRERLLDVIKVLHDYAKQLPKIRPWDENLIDIDDINNRDLTRKTSFEEDVFYK